MPHLVINDLEEDVELDAQAMRAVAGGKSGLTRSRASRLPAAAYRKLEIEESKLIPGLLKTPDLRVS